MITVQCVKKVIHICHIDIYYYLSIDKLPSLRQLISSPILGIFAHIYLPRFGNSELYRSDLKQNLDGLVINEPKVAPARLEEENRLEDEYRLEAGDSWLEAMGTLSDSEEDDREDALFMPVFSSLGKGRRAGEEAVRRWSGVWEDM